MFSRFGRPNFSSPMSLSKTVRVLPLLIVAGAGCAQTHYPSILPTASESDRRSLYVHDPLPETDIAPAMANRPRDFLDDWAEPRRTQQAQQLLGVPPGGAPPVPAGPPGAPGPPVAPGAPMAAPPGGAPPGMPVAPGAPTGMYPGAVPQ